MASSDITELLKSQERVYKGAMEVMATSLTERIGLHTLESTVSNLTANLEFSQHEIDYLKNAVKDYDRDKLAKDKTIETLTDQLKSSQQQIKYMEERINNQEDYSRRNNIRINGMSDLSLGNHRSKQW